MKISKDEKLICPFMSNAVSADNDQVNRWKVNCITDKCMAWETTKTKAIQDNFFKCTCGQTFDVYRYDFTCPSCGMEYSVIDIETDLPREDCEGYCRRLR